MEPSEEQGQAAVRVCRHRRATVGDHVVRWGSVGAAGAVLLLVLEMGWLGIRSADAVARGGGFAYCGALLAGVALSVGAVIGIIQGLLAACIIGVGHRLAGRFGRPAAFWQAALLAAALSPAIVWLANAAASGRWVSQLPGIGAITIAGALFMGGGVFLVVRVVLYVASSLQRNRSVIGGFAVAGTLSAIAMGLHALDRVVFSGLYEWAHITLEVEAFVAFELGALAVVGAVASMGLRGPAGERTRGWRGSGRWAFVTLLVALTATGAWATMLLRDAAAADVRAVLYEHSPLGGRLADLARVFQPTPAMTVPGGEVAGLRNPPLVPEDSALARQGSAPAPPLPDANIFLLTVDALRADHMGLYGYARATTPRLDELARTGVVFERAYTAHPRTECAIPSLLTGRHFCALNDLGIAQGHATIADITKGRGYNTAQFAFGKSFFKTKVANYEETHFGFEHVGPRNPAHRQTKKVIEYLNSKPGEKVFVFVFYHEPHHPYESHPEAGAPFGPEGMDRYDEEIRFADQAIGDLVEHIRRTRPDSIIAITADHGEEFGDHGGNLHGNKLYEELARVPLLILAPGLQARRVKTPVSLVDLAPTLLAMAGLPFPRGFHGLDRRSLMVGSEDVTAAPPVFAQVWGPQVMVVRTAEKLICRIAADYCLLFDLDADPLEQRNLASSQPARVAQLRGLITEWMGGLATAGQPGAGLPQGMPAHRRSIDRARLGDGTALPELKVLLSDGSLPAEDRRAMADALYTFFHYKPVRDSGLRAALTRAMEEDPDPHVRTRAGMALLWTDAPRALTALRAMDRKFLTANPELFAELAQDCGKVDETKAVELLSAALRALRQGEPRGRAEGALDEPGTQGDLTGAASPNRAFRWDQLWMKTVGIIEHIGGPGAASALLTDLRLATDLQERLRLVTALGKIGDRVALPELREVFRQGDGPMIRDAAIAIARLGGAEGVRRRGILPRRPDAKEVWVVTEPLDPAPDGANGTTQAAPQLILVASDDERKVIPLKLRDRVHAQRVHLPEQTRRLEVLVPEGHVLFR